MAAPRPVEVIDLDAELARVFQAPHPAFTDARNALAARLKAAGRADDSAFVKRLPKPTAPAWAVNQLAWRAPAALSRLRAAGDRLRHEQEQALGGGPRDLRSAMVERRGAVEEAVAAAVAALEQDTGSVTQATRERIASTCEAVATYGTGPGAPDVGRLTAEVASPGLSALTSLAAAARLAPAREPRGAEPPQAIAAITASTRGADTAAKRDVRVRPAEVPPSRADRAAERAVERQRAAEHQRALAAAKVALARAEKAAGVPGAALAAAVRARKEAERDAVRAQREADTARVRYERALDRSSEADRAVREAQQAEREATTRRDEAERSIREARAALRDVEASAS